MNIRIGNDIKLKFTVKGPEGFDQVNVKQMRVYLTNSAFETTPDKCIIKKRFPREPFPQFYTPTKYTLHGAGRFEYNVSPYNVKSHYSTFCGDFHDAHLWESFNGFGLRPGHFVDNFCHPCYNTQSLSPTFLAPSVIEEGKNQASAYFPACEQRIAGPYKMVVVLVVYDQGWGRNNLHTYTIDYGTIFNLVEDSTGMSGNVIIDVDNNSTEDGEIKSLKFANYDLYANANSTIKLGDNDIDGVLYNLQATLENGSTVDYRYDMW